MRFHSFPLLTYVSCIKFATALTCFLKLRTLNLTQTYSKEALVSIHTSQKLDTSKAITSFPHTPHNLTHLHLLFEAHVASTSSFLNHPQLI